MEGEATVRHLREPPEPPRCGNCIWAALHAGGVFCMQFREEIWSERAAEDCPSFESQDALAANSSQGRPALEPFNSDGNNAPERPRALNPGARALNVSCGPPAENPGGRPNSAASSQLHQELVEAAEAWLGGLHCSQWGRSMEVFSPRGRRAAAEWLAGAVEAVLEQAAS